MTENDNDQIPNRRSFLQRTAVTASAAWVGSDLAASGAEQATAKDNARTATGSADPAANMIGVYGSWAAGIVGDRPARLSFRDARFRDVDKWREEARKRLHECLLQPETRPLTDIRVDETFEYDGLRIERLSWQLPYGPRTKAVLLKPKDATGRLPAVLGLHDHGGMKYFGHEKITRVSENMHPIMVRHQQEGYGGVPWANELAKRGYAVLGT